MSIIAALIPLIILGIPALILWGIGIYALILLIRALKIYIQKNS
ncbi:MULTISPECIES: hypothetical protein [unclassified Clostridium]|nr:MULTISPECIES: hypothetical protein [unclassified Clostridium]EKQ54470.1 MAG: hypothetical protein A370_03295 [Clostridium sp. Maddingley MBC34-26]